MRNTSIVRAAGRLLTGLNRCANLEYRYAQAKIKNYISKGGYGGYGTKKGNFNRKKYQKNQKRKRINSKKLGELCGISESNIRKYENGKQNPKIETIEKIAKALGTTADELRGIKRDIAYNVDEIVEALNRYKAQQLENETLSYNGRWIACKVIEECIKIVKTEGVIHRR